MTKKKKNKCGEFRKRKGDIKSVWKVLTYNWESGLLRLFKVFLSSHSSIFRLSNDVDR